MKRKELVDLSFELNNFLLSEHLIQSEKPNTALFCIGKACIIYIRRFIYTIFLNVLKHGKLFRGKSYYKKQYDLKNIFFAPTLNNQRALEDIIQKTNCYFLIDDIKDNNKYPIIQVYLISLKTFIFIIRKYLSLENGKKKNIIGNELINYILTCGFYYVDFYICQNVKIRSLIVSNDHTNFNRAFVKAANEKRIITTYIQHASVADYYPELKFTYSFLDGLDSLYKYASCHNTLDNTTVILLGAARYDSLAQKRQVDKKMKYAIGIGINILDDEKIIEDISHRLSTAFPEYKVIIRAHPNWRKSIHIYNSNISFTSAYDESIDVFLNKIDVLIANDSCIHLDAIKFQVPTLMYTFSKLGFSDQYSFVNSKLVKYIRSYEDLEKIIVDKSFYIQADDIIRLFDNSNKREYEGNVSLLIANIINEDFDKTFYSQLKLKQITDGRISYFQTSEC